jgi:predicted transcriptional regulator
MCDGSGLKRNDEMTEMRIIIGDSLDQDGAAFVAAWDKAEHGEAVPEGVLAFYSPEALARFLNRKSYRLLRHLHDHPDPDVTTLAQSLGRQFTSVQADVTMLEQENLLDSSQGGMRIARDVIHADIRFG